MKQQNKKSRIISFNILDSQLALWELFNELGYLYYKLYESPKKFDFKDILRMWDFSPFPKLDTKNKLYLKYGLPLLVNQIEGYKNLRQKIYNSEEIPDSFVFLPRAPKGLFISPFTITQRRDGDSFLTYPLVLSEWIKEKKVFSIKNLKKFPSINPELKENYLKSLPFDSFMMYIEKGFPIANVIGNETTQMMKHFIVTKITISGKNYIYILGLDENVQEKIPLIKQKIKNVQTILRGGKVESDSQVFLTYPSFLIIPETGKFLDTAQIQKTDFLPSQFGRKAGSDAYKIIDVLNGLCKIWYEYQTSEKDFSEVADLPINEVDTPKSVDETTPTMEEIKWFDVLKAETIYIHQKEKESKEYVPRKGVEKDWHKRKEHKRRIFFKGTRTIKKIVEVRKTEIHPLKRPPGADNAGSATEIIN